MTGRHRTRRDVGGGIFDRRRSLNRLGGDFGPPRGDGFHERLGLRDQLVAFL
jgi:hypothetical protein